LSERYLFGVKKSISPAESKKEKFWLGVFGIASGIYRVIVFGGILLLVADRFFIIGIIMAAICAISWIFVPVWRFLVYLATNAALDRVRLRAIGVSAFGLAVLLLLLGIVKF